MKSEWIERMHDQARTEMGYCVQSLDSNWCTQHSSFKFPGEERCNVMGVAYAIAESAGEVMGELIAADIEALRLDPRDHCIDEYNAGLTNAARIARG